MKIQRLTLELNDLRKGSQITNSDMLKVLFMAEVERLHIILGDRTAEIETLRRNQQTGLSVNFPNFFLFIKRHNLLWYYGVKLKC